MLLFRIAQFLCVLATVLFASPLTVLAQAKAPLQLVMFERDDCPWCRVWHREIGTGYPKSDEGLQAPLRRVDLDRSWPADLPKLPILYTPTFVLMACNREVARFIGYPGADFFYPKIAQLIADHAGGAACG
ncbi:MAG: transcriptional regulator [Ferrovibrio sp.]|uniref:transcriptional regulator n=1 Tax=Ferrovibrio sp. TaxID=1917215 RepID=UPI00261DC987|nr:transcriptional regulator [Ferrovibrio sp.]MCW0233338.1 transcriptional regulator [Ferrovibrio sp.]